MSTQDTTQLGNDELGGEEYISVVICADERFCRIIELQGLGVAIPISDLGAREQGENGGGYQFQLLLSVIIEIRGDPAMSQQRVRMQEIQRHIRNIEREIAKLKGLIGTPKEDEPQQPELVRLRQQLVEEGLDEGLVRLVGTLSIRNEDYKEEAREAISARRQNQS